MLDAKLVAVERRKRRGAGAPALAKARVAHRAKRSESRPPSASRPASESRDRSIAGGDPCSRPCVQMTAANRPSAAGNASPALTLESSSVTTTCPAARKAAAFRPLPRKNRGRACPYAPRRRSINSSASGCGGRMVTRSGGEEGGMASETLIIVVGGDYLAFEICKEILKTAGHAVVLVWKHDDDDRAARLLHHEASLLTHEFGKTFRFLEEDPVDPAALRRAGLASPETSDASSYCLVAVSQDDRLNLRVSLLARDINEHCRITLRQFNPVLGHKIQEGLRYTCTAISPAAHAAATYAASAVDPSCFTPYGFRRSSRRPHALPPGGRRRPIPMPPSTRSRRCLLSPNAARHSSESPA